MASNAPGKTTADGFKDALSRLTAAVSVLAVDDRRLGGRAVTITSLVGVSLEPRLVAFFLDPRGMTSALLGVGSRVGVSVLGAGQSLLARQHSTSGRGTVNFRAERDAVHWCGSWVYAGSRAWLAGEVVSTHTVGDHVMYVVGVRRSRVFDTDPLVYAERSYATVRRGVPDEEEGVAQAIRARGTRTCDCFTGLAGATSAPAR